MPRGVGVRVPLSAQKKSSSQDCSFFVRILRNYIYNPSKPPFEKGGFVVFCASERDSFSLWRLGRLVYGRLLFAMQIFVLAVRLCLKRDFRHIAHQSRQSLIATTSLRFALGFCRRSSPAAACSIICHDIARNFEASDLKVVRLFCCFGANASTRPCNKKDLVCDLSPRLSQNSDLGDAILLV